MQHVGIQQRRTVMIKRACLLMTVVLFVCLAPSVRGAEGGKEMAKPVLKGHLADPVKDKDLLDKQLASYPMKTCVVSGKELGAKAVNYVYEGHLVKFCCPGCPAMFEKDSAKYLAMIDDAAKKTGGGNETARKK
jgi:hypothetical protein